MQDVVYSTLDALNASTGTKQRDAQNIKRPTCRAFAESRRA